LKPRLLQIREHLKIEQDMPLPVDVVMVSHVDDDHIKGILDLTREQRTNTPDVRLKVGSLWHNSFDDLLSTRPNELKAEAGFGTASLGDDDPASVLASVAQDALAGKIPIRDETEFQASQVLASIPQGRQLRDDAKVLKWKLNREFKERLIMASAKSKSVKLAGGLKITVIGPMQPELLALQEAYDEWIRRQIEKRMLDPQAALAAFVDESIPNLSSIVVLAELGKKRILLTGDARGDKILEGMELEDVLKRGGKTHVDILKVPHHGSDNNMDTSFFERVTADHYVFSGDGEHGNPERSTLEMLFEARPNAAFTIHLTYPVEQIDKGRREEWNKQQARKNKTKECWLDEKHSLKALLDEQLRPRQKVKIVAEHKPHVIDLLEPLGF
jgi:hypothetical protein